MRLETHRVIGRYNGPPGAKAAPRLTGMKAESNLKDVSDDELLRRLSELLGRSRRVEADLVAHIAEVDARGLYGTTPEPTARRD
jgi:hypothetical protein